MMQLSAAPARVPLHAEEPATLVEVYEQVVRNHPKSDTLNYKQEGVWRSISANEMLDRARNVAAGLHALGVRKGDRVAIVSDSRLEWVLADQGSIILGAVGVPIYPTLTPPQVGYILNDCAARVVFVSNNEKLQQLQTVIANCTSIEQVVLFDSQNDHAFTLHQVEKRPNSPVRVAATDIESHQRHHACRSGHDHLHLGHDRRVRG
jgi:long-chain acyl-CoA synthetase